MKKVIKRDNRTIEFNSEKIQSAIIKAAKGNSLKLNIDEITYLSDKAIKRIDGIDLESIAVEQIQDIVVETLYDEHYEELANIYQNYRTERTKVRDAKSELMKKIVAIGVETDRDNANVGNNFSAKLLRIASEANKWHVLNTVIPQKLSDLHNNGDIYIHDLDSYNLTLNCLHVPTGDLLRHGFNTGYGTILPPKHIEVAAELTCIALQATQNDMFGGQSHPDFDNDLAPFVGLSRNSSRKLYEANGVPADKLEEAIENHVRREVKQAMQAVVYNLNTMHSRAGSQVPFSSVNIGLPNSEDAALVCQVFLQEYVKGLGHGEQPIFPNIIFRVKKGVNRNPGDPYYYLYQLACKTTAIRMNPTFMNIDADFNKKYYDMGFTPATMGCRTYLMSNINGEPGVTGRGNNAPVTINLPRIGIMAKGNIEQFFKLLDKRIDQSLEILLNRYGVLKKLKVNDLPFVAGQALMRGAKGLRPNDSIEPIMQNGTWGIGYIGLAETLAALVGKHHGIDAETQQLGIKIIQHIRTRCDQMTQEQKMNISCYATPAEGLSGKFIQQDLAKFGLIPGVTDKEYYTNSCHIPVSFPLSISKKIELEAPYHSLSNGGHISYIEFDSYPTGENIEKIITWAYENTNINYLGMNFHIRYCKDCASDELVAETTKREEQIKQNIH